MICRMSFFCAQQDPAGQLEPFGRVGVVGPDLRGGQRAQRDLLGGVVEQHDPEAVAGELGADQVGERERHLLGRREAVLAVEDHRVRAVEHQHRRRADERYSLWLTIRSPYSMLSGTPSPSRAIALVSVAGTSRLSTSPNSYGLLTPSASTPVAR